MNKSVGVALTNASNKKRRELDFYPTPPDATHALMRFLNLPQSMSVYECACGDGDMAEVIKMYGLHVITSDLRDTGYGTPNIDFLETGITADAIITNPPFNMSESFIHHALTLSPLVAMLMKSQYWHAAKRTALFSEHPPSWVLPLNWRPDFMNGERGGSPTMDVAWSVWIRGNTDTRYRVLDKSDTQSSMKHVSTVVQKRKRPPYTLNLITTGITE